MKISLQIKSDNMTVLTQFARNVRKVTSIPFVVDDFCVNFEVETVPHHRMIPLLLEMVDILPNAQLVSRNFMAWQDWESKKADVRADLIQDLYTHLCSIV